MPDQTEARLFSAEIQINRVTSLLKKSHHPFLGVIGWTNYPFKGPGRGYTSAGCTQFNTATASMENDKIFSKTIQTRIDKKLMGEKVRNDSGVGKRSLYYLYYCFLIINYITVNYIQLDKTT